MHVHRVQLLCKETVKSVAMKTGKAGIIKELTVEDDVKCVS